MRYELKYTFSPDSYNYLENTVLSNAGLFHEIFHERQVNNIYFDTINLNDYYANLAGEMQRSKLRIRWYGDLHGIVKHPTLENKYKVGFVGGKNSVALPGFVYDNTFNYQEYFKQLKAGVKNPAEDYVNLVAALVCRFPTVVNRYSRRYFATPDRAVRVTIDRDIWFYHVQNRSARHKTGVKDDRLVLEVKYDADISDRVRSLLHGLGYRLGKNSKYVNGMNAVYFGHQLS